MSTTVTNDDSAASAAPLDLKDQVLQAIKDKSETEIILFYPNKEAFLFGEGLR